MFLGYAGYAGYAGYGGSSQTLRSTENLGDSSPFEQIQEAPAPGRWELAG